MMSQSGDIIRQENIRSRKTSNSSGGGRKKPFNVTLERQWANVGSVRKIVEECTNKVDSGMKLRKDKWNPTVEDSTTLSLLVDQKRNDDIIFI
jgi:hypothetical protein